jgi:hypothetical protein
MLPLVILLSCNIAILSTWTAFSPLYWKRVPVEGSKDKFGRYWETFGSCVSDMGLPYIITLCLVNGAALLLALVQAYKARHIKTEFSESKHIAVAMVSICQSLLLGIPLLWLVSSKNDGQVPSATYFVISAIIFVSCMSVLILIFVPKLLVIRNELDIITGSSQRGSSWLRRHDPIRRRSTSDGRYSINSDQARIDSQVNRLITENWTLLRDKEELENHKEELENELEAMKSNVDKRRDSSSSSNASLSVHRDSLTAVN